MNKPNNYDNVSVGGDWTPVELGGHYLTIIGLEERKSKAGADMIVVAFDFDVNDSQPGYFRNAFASDDRTDKKWPNNGTKYIMCEDSRTGEASRDFKAFITAVEKSNNMEVSWGDKFADQFKGKKVGAVFGEVENEYNGKTTMRHELRWFCEIGKVKDQKIPDTKYLKRAGQTATGNEAFMQVSEESVPF